MYSLRRSNLTFGGHMAPPMRKLARAWDRHRHPYSNCYRYAYHHSHGHSLGHHHHHHRRRRHYYCRRHRHCRRHVRRKFADIMFLIQKIKVLLKLETRQNKINHWGGCYGGPPIWETTCFYWYFLFSWSGQHCCFFIWPRDVLVGTALFFYLTQGCSGKGKDSKKIECNMKIKLNKFFNTSNLGNKDEYFRFDVYPLFLKRCVKSK